MSKYVCPNCGSSRVHVIMIISVNLDSNEYSASAHCRECKFFGNAITMGDDAWHTKLRALEGWESKK